MKINKETQPGTALAGERRYRTLLSFERCLILLLVLMFQASAQPAAAQDRLTKLDPEPVVVQLENGSGTADVAFILSQGAAVPEFRVTPAVGPSNTIPAGNIDFKWVDAPQTQQAAQPQPGAETQPNAEAKRERRAVLVGRLVVNPRVNPRVNVEPDTNYTGRVIFYWPDAAQPLTLNFVVSDRATLAFSVAPANAALTLLQLQPDTILLRIRNTGRAAIHKLSFSVSGLIDSKTQRRLMLPESEPVQVKDFGSTPLAPSHETEFLFKVPSPTWAGTYMGTVDVIADERARQSINLTLSSRGPTPGRNTYWVPFSLFVATLMLGYVLSNMLESWFNLGGLQRTEAQLSLQKSERELVRIAAQIEKWVGVHPREVFAQTSIRLQHDLNELRDLYRRIPGLTREELVAEAKRFALSATLAGNFESAVNVALKQWAGQPEKLNAVLTKLDGVAPGTDPNAYRASLRAVLEKEATSEDRVSVFDGSAALPDMPTPADLEKRIKRMAQLERAVAAAVVFIMAYQVIYAGNFAFGTLLDYIQVFLWSLGLTQMGTQLIARARSSYAPSP